MSYSLKNQLQAEWALIPSSDIVATQKFIEKTVMLIGDLEFGKGVVKARADKAEAQVQRQSKMIEDLNNCLAFQKKA